MDEKQRGLGKIGNVEDVCPHCSCLLKKRPQRKAKCPSCKNHIFVRTRPIDRVRVLVTESQAMEIDELWSEYIQVPPPRTYKKDGFEIEKESLKKKFGREPSENDVMWALLNKEIIEYTRAQHWGLYRNTLFEIGDLLRTESKWLEALRTYIMVCYIDLNGPMNIGSINTMAIPPSLRDRFKPFDPASGTLYPNVLAIVDHLIELTATDSQDLNELFLEVTTKLQRNNNLPVSPSVAWESFEKELFRA